MIRSLSSALLLSASALALAGCGSEPPPPIAYDSDAFRPAQIEADPPKPIEVVQVPEPLPLPGQLQPPPSVGVDKRSPEMRLEAANKAALNEPSRDGFVNAVQVYPYSEGALYHLYAAPEEVTDITLQSGETLTAVSAGDTVRWVVGDTTSGAGESKQVHVLVKPSASGLKTNLVIPPTDAATTCCWRAPTRPRWPQCRGPILRTSSSRFVVRTNAQTPQRRWRPV